MAPPRKASLRGGMRMRVRSRAVSAVGGAVGGSVGSCVGGAVGAAVEGCGAIGPAYRHFMTEQIVHLGKGARAADFG